MSDTRARSKRPATFVATRIGRKPLLLVRDAEGTIQLLHNQCAHRGSMVVASEAGHSPELRCCYHGWTYHLDGRLKVAPLLHGYPPHFDPKNPEFAMRRVPRVASYRGFVFGSLAKDGPSLEDFLGYMTTSFDDMVDRAPDDGLDVAGGVFKHTYKGNWKLYLENLCDAVHPLFMHQSSIDAAQQQSDDVHSDGSGEIAIRQMRQNGAPYSFWEANVGIWTYPNGHSFLGDYHDDAKLVAALNDPMFRDYIAAMEAKRGKEQTKKILETRRWNSNVYPNLSFMSQFQQLRVVHPVSMNETVVHTYCFRLRGAPARMFENAISFANIVNGTGLARAHRRPRNLQSDRSWAFRAWGRSGWRSAAATRAMCLTSTAAGAARTRPARSISATCSTPGLVTWRRTRRRSAPTRPRTRAPCLCGCRGAQA